MSKRFEVVAGVDELGEAEEFTWDLFPVVNPTMTTHWGTDGLPNIGTRITPRMIIVGKIGKTKNTPTERFFSGYAPPGPSTLDIYALPFDELHARYGHMWKESSLYTASLTTFGTVKLRKLGPMAAFSTSPWDRISSLSWCLQKGPT